MDPTPVLDHFRLSLANNKESVQLLARLARNGPSTTHALASATEIDAISADRLLVALYRAAFVEQLAPKNWAISELGEQVLAGLEILDIASADLAEYLTESPADRQSIKSWFEHSIGKQDSRVLLALLRSLSHLATARDAVSFKAKPSQVYASFIAAAPWMKRTGIENAADAVLRKLEDDLAGTTKAPSTKKLQLQLKPVAKAWHSAANTYLDSNRVLLFIPNEPDPSTGEETRQFTWLRALVAAIGGTPDEGLAASCMGWERKHAVVFWDYCLKDKLYEDRSRSLFEQFVGARHTTSDELRRQLTERLLKALTSVGARPVQGVVPDPQLPPDDECEVLTAMMRSFAQKLQVTDARYLSPTQEQDLKLAAKVLTAALRNVPARRSTKAKGSRKR